MTSQLARNTLKGLGLVAFTVILMLSTTPAMALDSKSLGHINDSGTYVSADIGRQNVESVADHDHDMYGETFDALSGTEWLYDIDVGYQFGHYFALEAGIARAFAGNSVGILESNLSVKQIITTHIRPKLIIPINHTNWNIFATASAGSGSEGSSDAFELGTGVGVGYRVNQNLEAKIQWKRHAYIRGDISNVEAQAGQGIQVGLAYHF